MGKKLFVGGISWETTKESLKSYFEGFGEIVDCTLKTDPATGRSRGFGFVEFAEESSSKQVLSHESHYLDGRNIHPKPATGPEPILKVFVGGLDPEVPEETIREHFEQFGRVEEINLPFDKMKNQRRAFCFVKFESEDIVDKAIAQPKQVLGSQEVDVKKAMPKSNQQGRGAYFAGYGGGQGGSWEQGGSRGRGRGYGGRSYYGNEGGYGNYSEHADAGYGGYGGYSNGGGWGGQGSYSRNYQYHS